MTDQIKHKQWAKILEVNRRNKQKTKQIQIKHQLKDKEGEILRKPTK